MIPAATIRIQRRLAQERIAQERVAQENMAQENVTYRNPAVSSERDIASSFAAATTKSVARLIVAAECAAHEKSPKCRRCQSLHRVRLQHMLNVIGHTLEVGVANVISGGVDFAGG
jgi:hypothetical protein